MRAARLLLVLLAGSSAFAQERYATPDWAIDLSDYGYSDYLIYTAGPFPVDWIHEMISGEWAAAIGYDGIPLSLPQRSMWLEPDFAYPTWITNSNFTVVEPLSFPFDSDADGLPEGFSVIANADVEIRLDHDFVDTTTGTPMGEIGGSVLSNRYVLRTTYTIRNLRATPLTGVRFYAFLHGHPANDERNTVLAAYDSASYAGALSTWRYDVTQRSQNTGAIDGTPTGCLFADRIGMSMDVPPADWGLGTYRGHDGRPATGLHLDVENDTLGNQTTLGPDEVAGALRRDLGTLQPGASASVQVLLAVRSEDLSPNRSAPEVCVRVQPDSPEPLVFVDKGACASASNAPNAWDIVAGSLDSFFESGGTVLLGTLECVANDLLVDRATDRTVVSDCRRGVYFLARESPGSPVYGLSSAGSIRYPGDGDCLP
jgi:hypothetical protein